MAEAMKWGGIQQLMGARHGVMAWIMSSFGRGVMARMTEGMRAWTAGMAGAWAGPCSNPLADFGAKLSMLTETATNLVLGPARLLGRRSPGARCWWRLGPLQLVQLWNGDARARALGRQGTDPRGGLGEGLCAMWVGRGGNAFAAKGARASERARYRCAAISRVRVRRVANTRCRLSRRGAQSCHDATTASGSPRPPPHPFQRLSSTSSTPARPPPATSTRATRAQCSRARDACARRVHRLSDARACAPPAQCASRAWGPRRTSVPLVSAEHRKSDRSRSPLRTPDIADQTQRQLRPETRDPTSTFIQWQLLPETRRPRRRTPPGAALPPPANHRCERRVYAQSARNAGGRTLYGAPRALRGVMALMSDLPAAHPRRTRERSKVSLLCEPHSFEIVRNPPRCQHVDVAQRPDRRACTGKRTHSSTRS